MNVDYATLEQDLYDGTFRMRLEEELMLGFQQIRETGERLPTASHYASQIAEIVNRGTSDPLTADMKYYLYQEILLACERARAAILGPPPPPPS